MFLHFSINECISSNSGFEQWSSTGTYQNPQGWATMNFLNSGSCTKGEKPGAINDKAYAIIKNNTALGQMQGGWGIISTCGLDFPFKPCFPISSVPKKLFGNYVYNGLGGDEKAQIIVVLFKNGNFLANDRVELNKTSVWTNFEGNFDEFKNITDADSATIVVFAFTSSTAMDAPKGNSELWIDNLSFDGLVLANNQIDIERYLEV